MTKTSPLLTMTLLVISSATALAQEESPTTKRDSPQASAPKSQTSGENNNAENSRGSNTSSSGSQRRQEGDKGGVFRPSEDISEDIAITFPVDI